MSGHLLGVAAVAALAAAGFVRKGSLSERPPVTNEDLADALRAYRPPVGSAARRKSVEVSPQDLPGQIRLPGFTDEELVRLGLAKMKAEPQPVKRRSRKKRPVDLEADMDRSAEEALNDEMSALAVLELQRQAAHALHEQGRRAQRQGSSPQPRSKQSPESDGPWELFLRSNPSDVSDQVLVALLLADGTGDPMERARVLLDQAMGSLGQLVEGSFGEEAGVPEATRARLIAAAELSRRAELRQMFTTPHKVTIEQPEQAAEFLRRMSRGPQEIVSALYMGGGRQVVGYRVIHKGGPRTTLIEPTEVFRPAIVLRAAGIIMAHQHPSGDPEPSMNDIAMTRRMVDLGQALGIPIDDSIVLGDHSFRSIRRMALVNFTPNRLS